LGGRFRCFAGPVPYVGVMLRLGYILEKSEPALRFSLGIEQTACS